MDVNEIPRLVAPLALAGAILLSGRPQGAGARAPVELEPGDLPLPSMEETRAGLRDALAPGTPGYDRGASRAAVTVLEFADFGCRYCASFATDAYPRLANEFVRTGKVRWKYVPFVLGMFPNGEQAARAAECAGEQGAGAFGRMHDQLYAGRADWENATGPDGLFRSYAGAAHLDTARFASCYASERPAERIRQSNALADRLAVRSTPTFFVNGYRIEGALPAEQFRALLLDALRQGKSN
jgi:protein-disulfide isomerase